MWKALLRMHKLMLLLHILDINAANPHIKTTEWLGLEAISCREVVNDRVLKKDS